MNILTANSILVSLLRDNIPNPASGTITPIWIYMSYPRPDVSTPRISISHTGSIENHLGIGDQVEDPTYGIETQATYDIDIWVPYKSSYTINGTKRAGTELRDYYSDEVRDLLLEKKEYLHTTYGFHNIELIGNYEQPYVDEGGFHRKTLVYRISFITTWTPS